MKIAVVYYSEGGNTKKVAENIAAALGNDVLLAPITDNPPLDGYDLIFLGTPIQRFNLPEVVKTYVQSACAGRRIALFLTHAAPKTADALNGYLDNCRKAVECATLVGMFNCQGQVADAVKQSWIDSGIPMLVQFGKLSSAADGQPDEYHLVKARDFAVDLVAALE